MENIGWIVYGAAVLVISGLIGMHLGKFREAYTEMTGMMAGMTMGMLNGFVLGYAAAAAANSMFWGNLIGVLLGLGLGAYYGRAGALMGVMDGAMGGVMGGSMGAMLAVMVVFPRDGLFWTAVLLGLIYIAGMIGLVTLIEQSAPEHAAIHRLLPYFTRAIAVEAAEEAERSRLPSARAQSIADYYVLLGIERDATPDEIDEAYLAKLSASEGTDIEQLERASAILSDPARRRAYDVRLRACCPPPRKARPRVEAEAPTAPMATAARTATPVRKTSPAASTVAAAVTQAPARQAAVTTRTEVRKPQQNAAPSKNGSKPKAQAQRQSAHNRRVVKQTRQSPISGVGVFMGVLLAGALVAWWVMMSGNNGSAAVIDDSLLPQMNHVGEVPDQASLESKAVAAQVVNGVQTVDMVVIGDSMSYRPDVIKVKQGMPVRFNLTTEGRDPG